MEQTDWIEIVALYDRLLAISPTPVVAMNRAIAVGEVRGPGVALALVDELALDNYYSFHATRADLLARLGRHREADAAFEHAADMAPTDAERDFLRLGGRTRLRSSDRGRRTTSRREPTDRSDGADGARRSPGL